MIGLLLLIISRPFYKRDLQNQLQNKLQCNYDQESMLQIRKGEMKKGKICHRLIADFGEVKTALTECKENASDESSAYLHHTKAP